MATDSERQQFGDLLQQNRKIAYKVANTYCRHSQDRDDLSQEILGQLWRAFPTYDPNRSFSTWMYRIALNVAISFNRSRKRRPTVSWDGQLHDLTDAGFVPEIDYRIRELYAFIDRLQPLDRALLLLYLEEHSYCEIAEVLGITVTNVATKISRLKERIRNDLKSDDA